jgi:hypothetical protein
MVKEGELDEQTQRYRVIRRVLTQLVTTMPGVPDRIRSGTAFQAARLYLQGHCVECGATLERHDYVLVHAQEMLRIGTSVASDVANISICPDCYTARCAIRQQFAPEESKQ